MTYEKLRMPSPSLLKLPPNRLVIMAALLPVAFWEAKHGIETEFSQGMMYAGRIWYKAMPPKEYQKYRIRLDDRKSSQWRLWSVVTRGMFVQYTASGAVAVSRCSVLVSEDLPHTVTGLSSPVNP